MGTGEKEMRTSLRLSICFSLVASLAGCGASGSRSPAVDSPAGLRLEEIATFGCDDCGGTEQIQAYFVALSPTGRVLMVDGYEPFIRIFEPGGVPVASFGVKGEGPEGVGWSAGRYWPPQALFPGPDGTVLVHDGMPSRIKRFSAAGELEANASMPQRVISGHAFDVDRQRLWTVSYSPLDGMAPRIDRYDDLTGPVTEPDLVLRNQEIFPLNREEDGRSAYPAIAATTEGGFVIGHSRLYLIRVFDENGVQVGEFGREIPRPQRSDGEMARVEGQSEQMAARFGRATLEPERELLHFTPDSFAYDRSGRLWVRTQRGRAEGSGRTIFDVFDAEGVFLQEVDVGVAIDGPFNDFAIDAGLLVGIVEDELDNTTIKVWRIIES